MSVLALAHARLGEFDLARQRVGEALRHIETTRERWFEAEVHRVVGDIAMMAPERDVGEAQARFEHARALARSQNARSRAATGLARLYRDQGKRSEALDLLAPVYGWFTQGFNTPDLTAAGALIESLQ